MLQDLVSPESFAVNSMDSAVLQRQREKLRWLEEHEFLAQNAEVGLSSMAHFHGLVENCTCNWELVQLKSSEAFLGDNYVPKFGDFSEMIGSRMDFMPSQAAFGGRCSRTNSCQMEPAMMMKEEEGEDVALLEKKQSTTWRENSNKRKAEFVVAEEFKDKRVKSAVEAEANVKVKSKAEISASDISKENSKTSEVLKPEYIHVRARRGQATDSHSLAERARREKISKKMKYLQDLVPGCNKVTGKAGMLDEIINYVQSLQRQVDFLSMKLAAISPKLEFDIDNLSVKEFPAYVANFPTVAESSAMPNLSCVQFNPVQEGAKSCVLDMSMNSTRTTSQGNTSSSVSIPKLCVESLSITQVQPFSTWNADWQDLHNAYNLGFH